MRVLLLALALGLCGPALADAPRVVDASARCDSQRVCSFSVTVRHGDTGWEHYADAWEVRLADGTVLGRRGLLHPHETEQPFTRSLGGVRVPEGVERVEIWAHDSVHGWGPMALRVSLP